MFVGSRTVVEGVAAPDSGRALPKGDFAANLANFSLLLFDFTAKLNINGFGVRMLAGDEMG